MRRVFVVVAGLLVVASAVLIDGVASQANTSQGRTSNPLSITGSVVAGVTTVQPGQVLTFDFAMKNRSHTPAAVDFHYTWTHANEVGIICPLISNGADILPDGTFCEPGTLNGGSSTQSALVVQAPNRSGTLVVNACADDENNASMPKCTSLSVPDVG